MEKCQAVVEIDLLLFGGKYVLERGHCVPEEMKDALDVNAAAFSSRPSQYMEQRMCAHEQKQTHTYVKDDKDTQTAGVLLFYASFLQHKLMNPLNILAIFVKGYHRQLDLLWFLNSFHLSSKRLLQF